MGKFPGNKTLSFTIYKTLLIWQTFLRITNLAEVIVQNYTLTEVQNYALAELIFYSYSLAEVIFQTYTLAEVIVQN
jgi:hypothetical protein